jgi:hypothetical protein
MLPMTDAVRLLEGRPRQFYCDACLAEALGIARPAVQDVVAGLVAHTDYRRLIERCDSCTRVTVAVGFVPPVKCAQCTWPIGDHDSFVADADDLMHYHCWRVLESSPRLPS